MIQVAAFVIAGIEDGVGGGQGERERGRGTANGDQSWMWSWRIGERIEDRERNAELAKVGAFTERQRMSHS